MERTEILSLFKNTPADGTEITVCGWAKNIRDSTKTGEACAQRSSGSRRIPCFRFCRASARLIFSIRTAA